MALHVVGGALMGGLGGGGIGTAFQGVAGAGIAAWAAGDLNRLANGTRDASGGGSGVPVVVWQYDQQHRSCSKRSGLDKCPVVEPKRKVSVSKIRFIVDGNIAEWARICLIAIGFLMLICGLALDFLPRVIALALVVLGMPVAAIGGYASRANALGLKPFDNSYKKARDSYKVKDDQDEK